MLSKALVISWTALFVSAFTIAAQSPPPFPTPKKTSQPQHDKAAPKKGEPGSNKQAPDEALSGITKRSPVVTGGDQQQASTKADSKPPTDWWSVATTGLLTVFNGALAYLTYRQWKTTRQQAEYMERGLAITKEAADAAARATNVATDTLIAAHPPKLIVRNVAQRPSGPAPTDAMNASFYVENVGGTDAKIIRRYATLCLMRGLPVERPYEGKKGEAFDATVAPGESGKMEFPLEEIEIAPPPGFTIASLESYIMGWIDYVDGSGHVRKAIFCRKWAKGRFEPVSDPEYENATPKQ